MDSFFTFSGNLNTGSIAVDPAFNQRYQDFEWFGTGEPMPPLREVRNTGFDAIVQFDNQLIESVLSRNIIIRNASIDLGAYDLSESLISSMESILNEEIVTAPVISYPPPPPRTSEVPIEFAPVAVELNLVNQSVIIDEGTPTAATIFWKFQMYVVGEETPESYSSRVDVGSFASGPDFVRNFPSTRDGAPVFITKRLTEVNLSIHNNLTIVARSNEKKIDVLFDFASTPFETRVSRSIFSELEEPLLEDFFREKLREIGEQSVAPTFQLGGRVSIEGILDSVPRFEVHSVGLRGNRTLSTVLALCIETGPGGRAYDLDSVVAITGQHNYAYYVSEHIVFSVLRKLWSDLPLRRKTLLTDIPVINNNRELGSATIQYEFKTLERIWLEVGSAERPDAFALEIAFDSVAISASRGGVDITDKLGQLAVPKSHRGIFLVRPFDSISDPLVSPDSTRFMRRLMIYIIEPLLMPLRFSRSALQLNYTGKISEPLGCVLTQGNITF